MKIIFNLISTTRKSIKNASSTFIRPSWIWLRSKTCHLAPTLFVNLSRVYISMLFTFRLSNQLPYLYLLICLLQQLWHQRQISKSSNYRNGFLEKLHFSILVFCLSYFPFFLILRRTKFENCCKEKGKGNKHKRSWLIFIFLRKFVSFLHP